MASAGILGQFCSQGGSTNKTRGQTAKLENAKNHTVNASGGNRQVLDFNATVPMAHDKAAKIMMAGPMGSSINDCKFSEARIANPAIAIVSAKTNLIPTISPKYIAARRAVREGIV